MLRGRQPPQKKLLINYILITEPKRFEPEEKLSHAQIEATRELTDETIESWSQTSRSMHLFLNPASIL